MLSFFEECKLSFSTPQLNFQKIKMSKKYHFPFRSILAVAPLDPKNRGIMGDPVKSPAISMGKNMISHQILEVFHHRIIPKSLSFGLFFLSHLKGMRDVSGCFGEILQKEHQHRNASLAIRNHVGHHELAI